MVRAGAEADLEALLDLAEARRALYAAYHPRFHRPAATARASQAPFFLQLLTDAKSIVLVHEADHRVDGFLIAQLVPAPPVYDPGGLTCMVDDFAVESAALWREAGRELLEALRGLAYDRKAAQIVVVCAPEDEAKGAMLRESGLSVVSEWLVTDAKDV